MIDRKAQIHHLVDALIMLLFLLLFFFFVWAVFNISINNMQDRSLDNMEETKVEWQLLNYLYFPVSDGTMTDIILEAVNNDDEDLFTLATRNYFDTHNILGGVSLYHDHSLLMSFSNTNEEGLQESLIYLINPGEADIKVVFWRLDDAD